MEEVLVCGTVPAAVLYYQQSLSARGSDRENCWGRLVGVITILCRVPQLGLAIKRRVWYAFGHSYHHNHVFGVYIKFRVYLRADCCLWNLCVPLMFTSELCFLRRLRY